MISPEFPSIYRFQRAGMPLAPACAGGTRMRLARILVAAAAAAFWTSATLIADQHGHAPVPHTTTTHGAPTTTTAPTTKAPTTHGPSSHDTTTHGPATHGPAKTTTTHATHAA